MYISKINNYYCSLMQDSLWKSIRFLLGHGMDFDRNLTRYFLLSFTTSPLIWLAGIWSDMVRFLTGILPYASCHSLSKGYLFDCKIVEGYGKIHDRNLTRYFLSFLVQRQPILLVRIWWDVVRFLAGILPENLLSFLVKRQSIDL